jgi:hypothetical protein
MGNYLQKYMNYPSQSDIHQIMYMGRHQRTRNKYLRMKQQENKAIRKRETLNEKK